MQHTRQDALLRRHATAPQAWQRLGLWAAGLVLATPLWAQAPAAAPAPVEPVATPLGQTPPPEPVTGAPAATVTTEAAAAAAPASAAASASGPAAADTMAATPALAASTEPALAPLAPPVGEATRGLLQRQRAGSLTASAEPRPLDGPAVDRAYQRYLKSFEQPLPTWFGQQVDTTD
jgi:hypothetical protein